MVDFTFERTDVALAAFNGKADLIGRGRIGQISRCTRSIGLCTICARQKQPVAFLLPPPASLARFPSDGRHVLTRKERSIFARTLPDFALWGGLPDCASPHDKCPTPQRSCRVTRMSPTISCPADHLATGIPIEPQRRGIVEFFWGFPSLC